VKNSDYIVTSDNSVSDVPDTCAWKWQRIKFVSKILQNRFLL